MTDRVRAVLITPDNQLLTIRRVRPGQEPYSVLPGGGVETGEDLNTALARVLRVTEDSDEGGADGADAGMC